MLLLLLLLRAPHAPVLCTHRRAARLARCCCLVREPARVSEVNLATALHDPACTHATQAAGCLGCAAGCRRRLRTLPGSVSGGGHAAAWAGAPH